MPKKTAAQLNHEIQETLSRKRAAKAYATDLNRRHLEDAIESAYDRKGSEDLTLAEACEAVRELLPSSFRANASVSDKAIGAVIRAQIPNWF
jgi:chemotaxis methyl-accepting protein methylase